MFCGMVTIGGARGLHDRRSGRSVVGSRLLGVLNWGTVSRPFEILAATAGYKMPPPITDVTLLILECFRYSAVLVVFLQLDSPSPSS